MPETSLLTSGWLKPTYRARNSWVTPRLSMRAAKCCPILGAAVVIKIIPQGPKKRPTETGSLSGPDRFGRRYSGGNFGVRILWKVFTKIEKGSVRYYRDII